MGSASEKGRQTGNEGDSSFHSKEQLHLLLLAL